MNPFNLPAAIALDMAGYHLPNGVRFVVVKPGVPGYMPLPAYAQTMDLDALDKLVAEANGTRIPTAAERQAAQAGSMFGWDVPGANPAKYA